MDLESHAIRKVQVLLSKWPSSFLNTFNKVLPYPHSFQNCLSTPALIFKKAPPLPPPHNVVWVSCCKTSVTHQRHQKYTSIPLPG